MILLFIFVLGLYFLVFAVLVALATVVVKKVWLSNKNRTVYNKTQNERKNTYHQAHSENKPNRYPTGWVFNENTQLWENPDLMHKNSNTRLVRTEPTYEEWKANRERKQHPEE